MRAESRLFTVNGVQVQVHDSGPPDGRPVFLLHGNPDTHSVWDDVVAGLSADAAGYRFLRPDMPGFGASPEPPAAFDYRAASTVPLWTGLFDQLALPEPALVVVHDFGGPWFLPWVARNPERVAGVVILDSPYHPTFQWHFWARVWQTPLLGELSARLTNRWLVRFEMRRGSRSLTNEFCDRTYADMHPAMQRSVLRTYRSHADIPAVFADETPLLQDALAGLPTRVVWGGRDPYLPLDQAHAFRAPVEVVAESGHWPMVEAPAAVVRAVRAVAAG